MTSASVVVCDPLFQNGSKVRLRDRNQPIQPFTPYRPDHTLADRVCFRTRYRRFQNSQAQRSDRVIEVLGEYSVPVMGQVPMRVPVPDDLTDLLQRPLCSGIGCYVHMRQATPPMLDHHEHLEHPERCRHSDEEVARNDRPRVVHQECRSTLVSPRLPRRRLGHVLHHRPRRNTYAKLQEQFIGDSLLTPYRIISSHPTDQNEQFGRNGRTPCSAFLSPEDPPSQSVPAHDGRWPDVHYRIAPITQPGE